MKRDQIDVTMIFSLQKHFIERVLSIREPLDGSDDTNHIPQLGPFVAKQQVKTTNQIDSHGLPEQN